MVKMIEVVAAVIVYQGKILAFRRGESKYDYVSFKYEFPGGKVEKDEPLDIALQRELLEELNLKASVKDLVTTVQHEYPDFAIKMHCFLAYVESYDGTLRDHIESAHVTLEEAESLDWIEADRPILDILYRNYRNVFL
jgi:8-oxo-dGTP diphosphatase